MDTDNLSNEAYEAVIIEAERFTHDLALHYGVLSSDCADEEEYLSKAADLTKEIIECTDDELDDLFFGEPPERDGLNQTLKRILDNIKKVRQIPLSERTMEEW